MPFESIPTWEWCVWLGATVFVAGLTALGIRLCERMVEVQRMRDAQRFHAADQDQWLDDCE